ELHMSWTTGIRCSQSQHAPPLLGRAACVQPEHVRVARRQSAEGIDEVDLRVYAAQSERRMVWHPLSVRRERARIVVFVDDFLLWILDAVQAVDPIARTLIAGVAVMLET